MTLDKLLIFCGLSLLIYKLSLVHSSQHHKNQSQIIHGKAQLGLNRTGMMQSAVVIRNANLW